MNNKPLSATILINRLQKKHNISDYKVASYVEWFWTRNKWPIDCLERGKTTQEIIKDVLPRYLVGCTDYTRKEKGIRALQREDRKMRKKFLREMKLIKKARDPQRKKLEIIHRNINIVTKWKQYLINHGYSNRAINNHIKERFGFYQIPKWLKQSEKTLERKADKIIDEIKLAVKIQKENDYLRLHPELLPDLCLDKKCKTCHNGESYRKKELKRLQNGVFRAGTNKWLDEQKFKKYKSTALRAKNDQELKEIQTRENEWNYLKNNTGEDLEDKK